LLFNDDQGFSRVLVGRVADALAGRTEILNHHAWYSRRSASRRRRQ
jgi:hypothetical protein